MFKKLKENVSMLADVAKEGASYIPDDVKNQIVKKVADATGGLKTKAEDSPSSDLTLNKDEAREELNKYEKNVNPNDIEKVNKKIGGMQKGDLKKVWDKVVLLWEMAKDSNAPWESKAMALGALIYTISPVDAIPDIMPVLGLTDDVGVILAAVTALGASLAEYADKKPNESLDNVTESEEHSYDNSLEEMKTIVSILAHGAYADNDLSEEEEVVCFEIIKKFIFSDNGVFPKDYIDNSPYTEKELKKIIADTFESPISLKKIASYAIDNETEKSFYLYAYAVIAVDDDINSAEREFLDSFAELLELTRFDKIDIEQCYKKDWLIL